jgi:hypothetical protein
MAAKNGKDQNGNGSRFGDGRDYRSENLTDSPMMARLREHLEAGEDIGHYGRLTFVMVARHFMNENEIVKLLAKQPGVEEKEARVMVLQVQERGYNPPNRERILQWQQEQEFQICPNPEDPNACNVYRDLQFPEEIYQNIEEFWEEKADSQEE